MKQKEVRIGILLLRLKPKRWMNRNEYTIQTIIHLSIMQSQTEIIDL